MSQRLFIRWIPVTALLVSVSLVWGALTRDGFRVGGLDRSHSAASVSAVFSPEVQFWAGRIVEWAAQFGLDPDLVATVMQIESCGMPSAVSPSGARGLFQVMPYHFAAGERMLDPDTNAQRGLAYLALGLARSGGDAGLALAGYNGGHGRIGVARALWPAETARYWYWGTGIYSDAQAGEDESLRLQEWLRAGGAGLCRQAAQELGLDR